MQIEKRKASSPVEKLCECVYTSLSKSLHGLFQNGSRIAKQRGLGLDKIPINCVRRFITTYFWWEKGRKFCWSNKRFFNTSYEIGFFTDKCYTLTITHFKYFLNQSTSLYCYKTWCQQTYLHFPSKVVMLWPTWHKLCPALTAILD